MKFGKLMVFVAIGVAAAIGIIAAIIFFSSQPTVADVKFIEFKPEGTTTAKQGQLFPITFNIENREPYPVSGVTVQTTYDGDPQFFTVDRSLISVTGSQSLGASGGRSGLQTINVIGNANELQAIEANFSVRLYAIDGQLTDTKAFKVRLEK